LILALSECPEGIEPGQGMRVVYDLARNEAVSGRVGVGAHVLVWDVVEDERLVTQCHKARLALLVPLDLDGSRDWVVRCDRVDFPPGGIAYRHVHPGPGIRVLLHGELTIDRGDGEPHAYAAREAWFEAANDPVLATASASEETSFVRVLLLPSEWAGKRTIRYLDPADEDRPRLQRATVLLEEPLIP
jgi:hypothetical protein